MSNIHEPQAINVIGDATGAIIFGTFVYLLLRDRAGTRLRGNWLSVAAAGLAFLWNAGSLAILMTFPSNSGYANALIFVSFSVLSLLPAVLLHLSLAGAFRPVIACGYSLSFIAVGLHLSELFRPGHSYQPRAFLLITIGFAVLTVLSVSALALGKRNDGKARASRMFGAMCSFLLALSTMHLGSGHSPQAWSSELVLHHAGIPLALFVLLQDYRFVLMDAFVRFLTNALIAMILALAAIRMAVPWLPSGEQTPGDPKREVFLLLIGSLLLVGFGLVQRQAQRLLTKIVFRRPDLEKTLAEIEARGSMFSDEDDFLNWAVEHLGEFFRTSRAEIISASEFNELGPSSIIFPVPASDVIALRHSREYGWVESIAPLRLAHADIRYLLFGRRQGGRRYLSEDLQSLNRLSSVIAAQIERFRNSEIQRLVSQAELRALQSQINPHFFFNALNTLYGIIPRNPDGARRTVLNLSEIFRYTLQSERTFIQLSEEMEIVKAYLEIERLRLGPRMQTIIDIDEAASGVMIPVLSIQPLVENAVKHGLAAKQGAGLLIVTAKTHINWIVVTVQDNGPGMPTEKSLSGGTHTGVGMANVRRRLQLCLGPQADLVVHSSSSGTRVHFSVPLDAPLRHRSRPPATDETSRAPVRQSLYPAKLILLSAHKYFLRVLGKRV